jgi:hypothetical protein
MTKASKFFRVGRIQLAPKHFPCLDKETEVWVVGVAQSGGGGTRRSTNKRLGKMCQDHRFLTTI